MNSPDGLLERDPVDAGRLHRPRLDPALLEPVGQAMQVGGEGPEGPHRLGIAAGTDRCHVQGGADVNGGRMGAAWGWTGAMSRAGRECFRRVMAGTSSGPGWRGGATRKNHFPNRDRLGVTPLKSAAARGPSLVSGSAPPKAGRPPPPAADHSAGGFSRHRRNQFRDRLGAHDLSGFHRRDRMLAEVRMARVIDAIELHRKKKLNCVEAGALLGMSERHFRRLRDAYEAHGAEGIIDRRRASGRRAGVDEIAWVVEEFRTRYFDFTAKHFHEAIHGRAMADGRPFLRSYTWTKSVLQMRGLVEGTEALGAPQEAGAPASARHASVPGRVEARLAA